MAVVTDLENVAVVTPGGMFSAGARAQYAALASMRWSMFRNSLRSNQGTMEFGARTFVSIFFGLMGAGIGAALGGGTYALLTEGHIAFLPVIFWAIFILWQVVPITMASFQEQVDISGLLRFPVGFGAYYLLHIIFGLVEASTILGCLCCLGVWVGITAARPDLSAWAALGLIVFAAFNICTVRAIFAWIDRWLAQRRTREILGAIFILGLLSLQFLNPALHNQKRGPFSPEQQTVAKHWLQVAIVWQRWLPPGLPAAEIESAAQHQPVPATGYLAVLGLYVLAAGAALGLRLHAEYRGESFGDAPSRKKAEKHSGQWVLDGSGPRAAVLEKELRTVMRSLPLLYGLGAPLIMVLILSGLFRSRGPIGGHTLPIGLMISMAYAMLGFTQMIYNNLGVEGAGIQLLFLSPTPIRTVILAKNIFHAALFAVDAILVGVLASLRMGVPSMAVIAATAAWLLFALPVHLAIGNVFSFTMPYRINLGRIGRQRGSQASGLLSMLVQISVLGIGVGLLALFSWLGRIWMVVPIFMVLAAAAFFAWTQVLANVGAMANKHRDLLLAKLVKAE